ncbi:MAG: hypothetical protein FOGNACKC_02280 [Anaerolineae bacterium]|nr:hypothetical protein [Anaerolineae bacterium]
MQKWLAVLMWIIALVVSLVFGLILDSWFRQTTNLTGSPLINDLVVTLPTLFTSVVMLLYHQIDGIYFTFNRWRLKFGALITVEFGVELRLSKACNLVEIRKLFEQRYPHSSHKEWAGDDKDVIFLVLPNTVIRVHQTRAYEYDDSPYYLYLESTEVEMPFRTWLKILGLLTSFFHDMQEQLSPKFAKYTCNVLFRNGNPYYGLFLRKARAPQVDFFEVSLTENVGGISEYVSIGKSRVSISAESPAGWQTLSQRYVALSNPVFTE